MGSFSMVNNFGYNLTLSIPTNTNFTTYTNSYYNDVPQLQLRLRLCPVTSPYYNTADKRCYTACPITTYPNSSVFICTNCSTACLVCLNGTTCTNCSAPFVLTGTICSCPSDTYYFNNTCYGCDYSCLTCTASGQYFNCLTCNTSAYRHSVAAFPFSCDCNDNYTDTGSAQCTENCGDGLIFSDQCDDKNRYDGDGCSSTCQE